MGLSSIMVVRKIGCKNFFDKVLFFLWLSRIDIVEGSM